MSYDNVVNQVNTTQSMARSLAQSAVSATNSLVSQAVGTLTGYTPDFPQDPLTAVARGASLFTTEFEPTQKPPNFPTIRTAQDVQMGELGHIDTLDDTFDETAPTVTIPSFSFTEPTALTPFTKTAPSVDSTVTVPDSPTIDYPDLPALLAIDTDIELQDLVIPPLSITMPSYNNLLADTFVAQFAVGQSAVPNPDDYGTSLMARFFPEWLATVQQMEQRINGVLAGSQTALTDTFDARLYEQMRTRVREESDTAFASLDQQTKATGWDLPGATRAAGAKRIQQEASKALQAAALEVYNKRAEREVQHLQYVLGQALPLHQAAVATFSVAFDMSMKQFDGAMQYADTAMKFAVTVYQLKQRDYELAQALVDKQIAIFQALLDAELAKLKVTEARLTVEKLKIDVNQQQVQLYTAQLDAQRTKVGIFQAQIDALRAEIEARKLPLDVFESEVRAFAALAGAKRDEYALVDAKIRADEGKLKGQLAKLEVYKTEADVFATVVGARAKKIDGQIQRNQQILKEFEIKQGAEVDLTKIDAMVAENALDAYKAMAEVYIAESKQRLEAARLDFEETMANSKLEITEREFEFNREFKNLEIEMTRVKAIAEMQLSAAQVQGQQASAALSIMNTMAELSAQASA
jgi:hypothetical protein